ncbi:MAG TPA: diaminopimelate decarboxylase [Flavobacterium sp.]|nr:diaminopimelate decarboxylase [Flavobacterium sp.]
MTLTNFVSNNHIETPAYIYDISHLKNNLAKAKSAADQFNFHIHYAIKANNNSRILDVVQSFGFGADCVSGREIELAISSGFSANDIFFAGVGKTDEEIIIALNSEISAFNVESIHELQVIGEWAKLLNKTAKIALRINPDVDAHTHQYITTGLQENKFGIFSHEITNALDVIRNNQNLHFVGLHFHVGSQITDLDVFKNLCLKVNEWNHWFSERGFVPEILNLGGGLGVDYHHPDAVSEDYFFRFFSIFSQFLEPFPKQQIHFELGRSLVASCGSLLSKVLYIKHGLSKNFAILDAGMTELLRPALYQAFHSIQVLNNSASNTNKYDVVGPICESSDCFGKDILLPELNRGNIVAIRTAGAYGEVMSSRYNLRKPLSIYFIE